MSRFHLPPLATELRALVPSPRRLINPIGGAINVSSQLWLDANLVRLHRAVLCANCEVISEGKNGHCAACGSQALLSLGKLLGSSVSAEIPYQTVVDSGRVASDTVHSRFLSAA
jgi:hypothetical protein